MRTNVRKTVQLGELIVAVYDIAAQHSTDPREISRLATGAVMRMLLRAWMTLPPRQSQQHLSTRVPFPDGGSS